MSAIGSSLGTSGASGRPDEAFGALSSQEFLEVIFTELQAQDPLAPNDTGALLDQLSTIRSIESDIKLAASIEELISQNEIASASALVGSFVTGFDELGLESAGFVDSVRISDEGSLLALSNGSMMKLGNVKEIIDPALIGFADDDSATGGSAGEPEESSADAPDDSAQDDANP